MAEFKEAFENTMDNEGGFVLHKVKGDSGGLTYAGITQAYHPHWPGWRYIGEKGSTPCPELLNLVQDFYEKRYWEGIRGKYIEDQQTANSIYDFVVNAGLGTASKIVQKTIGAKPDGILGPISIRELNRFPQKHFYSAFAVAKVDYYIDIVQRKPSQRKFFLGWTTRAISDAQEVY